MSSGINNCLSGAAYCAPPLLTSTDQQPQTKFHRPPMPPKHGIVSPPPPSPPPQTTASPPPPMTSMDPAGAPKFTFVGCYADSQPHALPNRLDDGSVESCASQAYVRGYSVFALEYGSECYAGNNLTKAIQYGSPPIPYPWGGGMGGVCMQCGNWPNGCGDYHGWSMGVFFFSASKVPTPAFIQPSSGRSCENGGTPDPLVISCPAGMVIIKIKDVFYGESHLLEFKVALFAINFRCM